MARVAVAIALIEADGRWLVQQRPAGRHLAGTWEFPGGKVASGETAREAVAREVREELGLQVAIDAALPVVRHDYPDRQVVLHPFICHVVDGTPAALEGQAIRWVTAEALASLPIPAANRALVESLPRLGRHGRP